ncbi:MAG: hypothetical protein A2908_04355 [Candidatus Staskawiczbacteria bacterium RIFCSPLOWO2_01_FULL_38_12b]|uniref:Uncharacterized protein n=1 Tax=Candidatus Staskawiczbacteria bacterium RIFCSPLOWO2_01_FULL_38_12b TaxID=1802214 RepID=A0A1G2ID58_9BACT|nr:MAG: hypothetical protein A2908_04355 [Candidatus Staskawiczbacteria bacterium RIFCSPLOWO2_01_FULL_38_12b]
MYESPIKYQRTREEKVNQLLAWKRSDKAFFAAGACHILAFAFRDLQPQRNLELIFIRPKNNTKGSHVYVLDGEWAFDFNGWTKEKELLETTQKVCRNIYPTWDYDKIFITEDLENFCKNNNHRLPAYFAYLP